MPPLAIPSRDRVPVDSKPLVDTVEKLSGFVPNVVSLLASSPLVLKAFLGLQGTLASTLDTKVRHAVALSVSNANG